MEVIRKVEGESKEEPLDDFTAYERLLNKMFTADENMQLKTEFYNPIEFARFYFVVQMIKDEGKAVSYDRKNKKGYLDDEAEALMGFGFDFMKNMVSKNRGGRVEGFGAIKSFNYGKSDFDDQEKDKFKRVIKDLK